VRRVPLRVICAALVAVWAMTASASAGTPPTLPLTLKPVSERYVKIAAGTPGQAGRVWGFWGKLTRPPTPSNPTGRWGRYRAICSWIADSAWASNPTRRDNRFLCTLVLSFRTLAGGDEVPHGGTVVAQGLIRLPYPNQGLFADAWRKKGNRAPPKLPITGATGPFENVQAVVNLSAHVGPNPNSHLGSQGYISIESP
jgi:hypothetical protein